METDSDSDKNVMEECYPDSKIRDLIDVNNRTSFNAIICLNDGKRFVHAVPKRGTNDTINSDKVKRTKWNISCNSFGNPVRLFLNDMGFEYPKENKEINTVVNTIHETCENSNGSNSHKNTNYISNLQCNSVKISIDRMSFNRKCENFDNPLIQRQVFKTIHSYDLTFSIIKNQYYENYFKTISVVVAYLGHIFLQNHQICSKSLDVVQFKNKLYDTCYTICRKN